MDKINENAIICEAKDNEDKNLPASTFTIIKKSDDSGEILPPTESKSNESEDGQQTSEGDSLAISDLQREKDNKTPEELIEEVGEEVNKLNISSEQQIVVDKANESLKNVLVYNNSDSSDSEELDIAETDQRQPNLGNCNSNKNEKPAEPNKAADFSSSDSQTDSSSEDSDAASENKKSETTPMPDSDSSDSESDSACTLSSDSDSDDSDSDAESDRASVIDIENENIEAVNISNNKGAVKKTYSFNITGFEEADCIPIPDISNLNINDEVEFMLIGSITYIIAEIATVTVIPGTPAFDLDSMLFIEHENVKKPMGPIFDVIGPVANPIYCVRFNSAEDIKKMGLKSGTKVFAAPKSQEFTKFVFLPDLLKMKHSDASYRNDTEVPVDMAEFSDDEKEREARRKKVGGKRKINDNSLERHKKYEQIMNRSNSLYTKLTKLGDFGKKLIGGRASGTPQANSLPIPPEFDPTVPPPGFGQVYTNYHYSMGTMLTQHQSMYEYDSVYRASLLAMQNTANAYASELDYANQFAPPPPRDYNPSQNQQPPSVNSYLCQNLTNNTRNNKGPGPSSQPF